MAEEKDVSLMYKYDDPNPSMVLKNFRHIKVLLNLCILISEGKK